MRTLTRQLFGTMPREFASPQRRAVDSFPELTAMIDHYNGRSDCFVSAYPFASDERSYADVLIDKAIFDFDDAWGDLVRTHEWLEERGAAHFAVFSGSDRSGHIYILVEPTTHQQSLEYFQRDVVIAGAGLRRCRECGEPVERVDPDAVAAWECTASGRRLAVNETRQSVDDNLVGDPTTHVRVPNTMNPGADRFAVPLEPEEIDAPMDEIYSLATEQRDLELADIVSGSRTPDITQKADEAERLYRSHEEKRKMAWYESDDRVMEEFEAQVTPVDMLDGIGCECVRSLFLDDDGRRTNPDLGHHERRVLISYLVERGYNPAEIASFLKFAISEEKARHSIAEEEQPIRIWRDGVKAPNARTLKQRGLFVRGCPEHSRAAPGAGA